MCVRVDALYTDSTPCVHASGSGTGSVGSSRTARAFRCLGRLVSSRPEEREYQVDGKSVRVSCRTERQVDADRGTADGDP